VALPTRAIALKPRDIAQAGKGEAAFPRAAMQWSYIVRNRRCRNSGRTVGLGTARYDEIVRQVDQGNLVPMESVKLTEELRQPETAAFLSKALFS
jgi:hypothetical protein